ncbi:TIR domain-containing protein [Streptomyces sp. URMC 129]|uniref:TIR domain-containing protein n=1 Tax=Streptomyces sp. URMC 129 TaxID=3423407 RepID=UPI003F1C462A
MGYQYDVFLSYRRSAGNVSEWLTNHFHQTLMDCLANEMPTPPQSFIDRQLEEEVGTHWPDRIAEGLRRSRLLVPILSAPYFSSYWCVAEWKTMALREEVLGISRTDPGLIYPIVYADGKHFPDEVRDRELCETFKEYAVPVPSFQLTPAFSDFYQEVARVARAIAARLEKTPPWDSDWPVVRPEPYRLAAGQLPRLGLS